MRGVKRTPIELTNRQRTLLERLARRQTCPHQLVQRAQIILAAADGRSDTDVAQGLAHDRGTVRIWRTRWLAAAPQLAAAEATGETDLVLLDCMSAILADAPRSGAPDTFSAEQVVQIVALACTPPPGAERPTTHWTPRELADEAAKRGIVAAISPRSVGRFLKSGRSPAAPQPLLVEHQGAGPTDVRGAG